MMGQNPECRYEDEVASLKMYSEMLEFVHPLVTQVREASCVKSSKFLLEAPCTFAYLHAYYMQEVNTISLMQPFKTNQSTNSNNFNQLNAPFLTI
jgi:hypothetical protein